MNDARCFEIFFFEVLSVFAKIRIKTCTLVFISTLFYIMRLLLTLCFIKIISLELIAHRINSVHEV